MLAKMTGASMVALHVYPRFAGTPYGTYGPAKDILAAAHVNQHADEAEKLFDETRNLARAAGVSLETVLVESDDIHQQIIAVAKRKKSDLICMAAHGRRGLAGLLLGSVSHAVLTHSKVPVLVVR
jgi:nucleotide-binding universal stress UspA family protein